MWKDTQKLQCWKIIVSSANMKFIKLVLTEMLLYMISRLYLLYICSGKPCCQTAPRHYLVQCYLTLNKNQLILCSGGNVIEIVSRILVIFSGLGVWNVYWPTHLISIRDFAGVSLITDISMYRRTDSVIWLSTYYTDGTWGMQWSRIQQSLGHISGPFY